MLTFSTNPDVAEQQMNAIIFYLTAFGYIDGQFDFTEKTFVRIYIRQLVTARAQTAMPERLSLASEGWQTWQETKTSSGCAPLSRYSP